ncbi:MAG: hypothetical protein WD824_09155 [Cyclobacteriaceae bacterium]
MYVAYPLLVWNRLDKLLSVEPLFERTRRKGVILTAIVFLSTQMIVPFITYEPGANAMSAIFLFSLIFLCSVAAKQLKSIEIKRNAGIWEYAPDTFNFMMWPLGVFWIQPRLNEIPEKQVVIKE